MNRPTRVLLVDDEPAVLQVFSRLLQREGYEVCEATSGQQALQLAHARRPDVAILDVVMPEMSGPEICRRIKADPALADTFVVLISGHAISATDTVGGLETGA